MDVCSASEARKVDTATLIKCDIAAKSKTLNWRAVVSTCRMCLWDFQRCLVSFYPVSVARFEAGTSSVIFWREKLQGVRRPGQDYILQDVILSGSAPGFHSVTSQVYREEDGQLERKRLPNTSAAGPRNSSREKKSLTEDTRTPSRTVAFTRPVPRLLVCSHHRHLVRRRLAITCRRPSSSPMSLVALVFPRVPHSVKDFYQQTADRLAAAVCSVVGCVPEITLNAALRRGSKFPEYSRCEPEVGKEANCVSGLGPMDIQGKEFMQEDMHRSSEELGSHVRDWGHDYLPKCTYKYSRQASVAMGCNRVFFRRYECSKLRWCSTHQAAESLSSVALESAVVYLANHRLQLSDERFVRTLPNNNQANTELSLVDFSDTGRFCANCGTKSWNWERSLVFLPRTTVHPSCRGGGGRCPGGDILTTLLPLCALFSGKETPSLSFVGLGGLVAVLPDWGITVYCGMAAASKGTTGVSAPLPGVALGGPFGALVFLDLNGAAY
ncbi:hypothetical protein PR048_020665 [Dryococelus australis]|uniref:Uncharacterized protein n=1 Tax=Dryococelus australis TaxID=614101 RepID=A0ABQ9H7C9_9NEOP|nr:hypothetical protein PR048_020665 [Dryococelus australis]